MIRGTALAIAAAAGLLGTAAMAQKSTVNALTSQEKAAGWRLLFDGKSLDAWRGFKKQDVPASWKIVDGVIALTDKAGDLITKDQFADFELSLEWKLGAAGGNSGIFYHVLEEGGDQAYFTGPEYQILQGGAHEPTPLTSTGSNYLLDAPVRDVARPLGQWNETRIVVKGPHVEHWLNGVKLLEYQLWTAEWEKKVAATKFGKMPGYGKAKTGHIGLQDHGDPIQFRNIKIRPLPLS